MADLTTLANVKRWLGTSGTTDDALLSQLISAFSTWAQTYMDRTIAQASYTETRNGDGHTAMIVRNGPMTAIASLTVNGVAIAPKLSAGGAGYSFDPDFVYLDAYTFSRGRQNVVIQYTGGYAATPADLEQAAIEMVALKYRERERIGLTSKGLSGETTTFLVKALPDTIQSTLDHYRRVVLL